MSIASEMICLINDNYFESLACRLVHLLCLRHLFQQILNNDAIEIANIRGCDLKVVDGCDNIEFELSIRRCLEDPGINLDLFYARTVELSESRYDTSLLTGARGSVYEQMRKVSALRLITMSKSMS